VWCRGIRIAAAFSALWTIATFAIAFTAVAAITITAAALGALAFWAGCIAIS
jgi:hypothetical protein